MQNVMRIDFEIGCCNSDGKLVPGTERGVCVLYNSTVIKEDEVRELIRSGMYEYDKRLVITTPAQADNLRSRNDFSCLANGGEAYLVREI